MKKEFKYKLDFYYQQTLIYLSALVLYAGIRGSFIENQFSFVFNDPIVLIFVIFFFISLVTLFLNVYRNRKLIVYDDKIVFHSRGQEREVPITEIEWMHIGRERSVQTAGRFQLVIFKVRGRRWSYRIRVGRYERDRELVAEMEKIAPQVPKGKRRQFGVKRRTHSSE
jgi:hypothetical protein